MNIKYINQSFEVYDCADYTPEQMIEMTGRTCYKSEDKITQDSAIKFVERMKGLEHNSMLEHGTIVLVLDGSEQEELVQKYKENSFSKIRKKQYQEIYYVGTNLRVIHENDWYDDLEYQIPLKDSPFNRYMVKFIISRATANEFVRHSVFSYGQESTRYCNYCKNKFDNTIQIIDSQDLSEESKAIMDISFGTSAKAYSLLIKAGAHPEQARKVLPLQLKTEICMTGWEQDWPHFFELRTSKAAHPDTQSIIGKLIKEPIFEGLLLK